MQYLHGRSCIGTYQNGTCQTWTLTTQHLWCCVVNAPDFWIVQSTIKNEQVDNLGYTALILACQRKMKEVALELIKTGHAKPEQVCNRYIIINIIYGGDTALIYACQNVMTEVALELIKTGKSNQNQITRDGKTAFSWACENSMREVAYELVSIGAFTTNDLMELKSKKSKLV